MDRGGGRTRVVGWTGTLSSLQSLLSCSLPIGNANHTVDGAGTTARAVGWKGHCTAVCKYPGLCLSAPLSNSLVQVVL